MKDDFKKQRIFCIIYIFIYIIYFLTIFSKNLLNSFVLDELYFYYIYIKFFKLKIASSYGRVVWQFQSNLHGLSEIRLSGR